MVEEFAHVSLRHVHPLAKTCLLGMPQMGQVTSDAFVVESGVDALTPHQLGFELGPAYSFTLHHLRPQICGMVKTKHVDRAMGILCTYYIVNAVALKDRWMTDQR